MDWCRIDTRTSAGVDILHVLRFFTSGETHPYLHTTGVPTFIWRNSRVTIAAADAMSHFGIVESGDTKSSIIHVLVASENKGRDVDFRRLAGIDKTAWNWCVRLACMQFRSSLSLGHIMHMLVSTIRISEKRSMAEIAHPWSFAVGLFCPVLTWLQEMTSTWDRKLFWPYEQCLVNIGRKFHDRNC